MSATAITESTTESGIYRAFNEWLAAYFDGASHNIGYPATAVTFPKVDRAFGEGEPAQPLYTPTDGSAAEIRLDVIPRSENEGATKNGKLVTSKVLLNFWVSAKKPGTGASEYLATDIAEKLKLILGNPECRIALARLGIRSLRPYPPQWLPSADYSKRLVSAMADVQYEVKFQSP